MFLFKTIKSTFIAYFSVLTLFISMAPLASDSVYTGACECTPTSTGTRSLPVTVRDFKSSHPDFEGTIGQDYDIVTKQLGEDDLPVYASTSSTHTTTGVANFDQWYRDVEGVNITIPMTMVLKEISPGFWEYSNQQFFPIDGMGWATHLGPPRVLDDIYPSDWWKQGTSDNIIAFVPLQGSSDQYQDPKSGHNFHFTLETHLEFDYNGGEEFTFIGDDDVYLYINRKLAINLGGVHSAIKRHIKLDEMAQYLNIEPGNRYRFDLFFAERHLYQSNFKFQTSINLECL